MRSGGAARIRWGSRDLDLCFRVHGESQGAPVVLVAGMGRPSTAWPDALLARLVGAGLRVVVYDHRETGGSSRLPDLPRPQLGDVVAQLRATGKAALPYDLEVLAGDLVQLLDHLGMPSAHLVGASMGGMLAQIVAARQPQRVRSLALLRTGSGQPGLPPPQADALAAFAAIPPSDASHDDAIRYEAGVALACAGPASGMTADAAREAGQAIVASGWFADGIARHLAAVVAGGDRRPLLQAVRCPAAVIHGTHDRLVHPDAGRALARDLDAPLHWLPGAGHELPGHEIPTVAAVLQELVRTADARE